MTQVRSCLIGEDGHAVGHQEYTYNRSLGKPVNCYYCPNCTAHVYHHQTVLGSKIIIRTGLIQGGKKFPVAAEIFGKDKLDWQPAIAPKVFDGPPE